MCYRQIHPFHPLNEIVDSIYYLKDKPGQTEKKILPDYKTDLIFLFESNMTGYTTPGRNMTVSTSVINGFRRTPLHFRYNGNVDMLGIRFFPYGFTQLFGIPPVELTTFIEVEDVLNRQEYADITERIFLEQDPESKISIVETWLLNVLKRKRIETSLAIKAVHRIAFTKGVLPLSAVCNHSPSEYKQLQRFCHDKMDISPKSYSRMVRFEYLHQSLMMREKPDWMDLVAELDFTDQSHMIREIREFTGLTPGEFFTAKESYI